MPDEPGSTVPEDVAVYGDRPNHLPLVEQQTRWEITSGHEYQDGITETMPIDSCLHSIFGVGKVAADIAVQEYGRYFGLNTATFRCGTLIGPAHAAAELHGFLAFLMRCAMEHRTYRIFGYGGNKSATPSTATTWSPRSKRSSAPPPRRDLQHGRWQALPHQPDRGRPTRRKDHR